MSGQYAGTVCLATRHWMPFVAAEPLEMPTASAQALANFMPLLLCGEVSAECVFTQAAQRLPVDIAPRLKQALLQIADDEKRHGELLLAVRSMLPSPAERQMARRAAHFLRRLATDDLGLQMARLAALDAGFCLVLAALCRPGTQIAALPALRSVFDAIRCDEGRHVRVSRDCADALGISAVQEATARRQVLNQFAALLAGLSTELSILGLDSARLLNRLRRIGDSAPAP